MQLIPKKWADFQHYKDRCPPWIKLHRELLNNRDFICLPLASKALAPLLWLLASEAKDGVFDASTEELEFRLRFTKEEILLGLKPLIDKGFFIIASGALAECVQPAIPEKRRVETKKEKEAEREPPEGVSQQTWDDWLKLRKTKRAPVTQTVIDGAFSEAGKAGMHIEDFLKVWCRRGSQGLEASWLKPDEKQSRNSNVVSGLTRGLVGGTNGRLLG